MARRKSMSVTDGSESEYGSVWENILTVATAEFAEHGFAGARVDEIAAKTATSKRMIYYHFGGKDGLYREVLDRAYSGVRAAESIADLDRLPVTDALRRIVEITFDYHADHPEFVRLVMDENIRRGVQIEAMSKIEGGNRSILAILASILVRGTTEGLVRENVDALDLHLAMSALSFYPVSNHYTVLSNFGRDMGNAKVRRAQRATAVDLILRYCLR
jgi:AcrR family transcriptional regulator